MRFQPGAGSAHEWPGLQQPVHRRGAAAETTVRGLELGALGEQCAVRERQRAITLCGSRILGALFSGFTQSSASGVVDAQ